MAGHSRLVLQSSAQAILSQAPYSTSLKGLAVVQWNINGYYTNLPYLDIIQASLKPQIIVLQETHLDPVRAPKTYKCYKFSFSNCLMQRGGRAKGGVGILVHKSLRYTTLPVPINLEAQAVMVHCSSDILVINIYLRPGVIIPRADLKYFMSLQNNKRLVLGDFNAHNVLWGCQGTDGRGRLLQELLEEENLILLNDGSPTFLSNWGTENAIDLSLADATLAGLISWSVRPELGHEDHYPVVMSIDLPVADVRSRARFNVHRANWPLFYSTSNALEKRYPPQLTLTKKRRRYAKC